MNTPSLVRRPAVVVFMLATASCHGHPPRATNDPPPRRPRLLVLSGTHEQIGEQHGSAVRDLRARIQRAVEARLERARQLGRDAAFDAALAESERLLQAKYPGFLEMIRGQARALSIDYRKLLAFNLISFLMDQLITRKLAPAAEEGCSTFAASGDATRGARTLLVKNRDYQSRYLDLQVLAMAKPKGALAYLAVTTAGAAGVFSGGVNEAGLACVDTHVSSVDVGAGFPNSALLMYVLERCHTVDQAIDFLRQAPRIGRNTISLADASGTIAVCELGNRRFAVTRKSGGVVVATNHFQTTRMAPAYRETSPPPLRGNSPARRRALERLLRAGWGSIDVALAKKIMTHHGQAPRRLDALCRHVDRQQGLQIETVSEMIFDPAARVLHFSHGYPCAGRFFRFGLNDRR